MFCKTRSTVFRFGLQKKKKKDADLHLFSIQYKLGKLPCCPECFFGMTLPPPEMLSIDKTNGKPEAPCLSNFSFYFYTKLQSSYHIRSLEQFYYNHIYFHEASLINQSLWFNFVSRGTGGPSLLLYLTYRVRQVLNGTVRMEMRKEKDKNAQGRVWVLRENRQESKAEFTC